MPFRVREILLVSSSYDAFVLEEDGSLSDRLFHEYSELSLSWAPRLTHAVDLDVAMRLLSERRFDLVLTVAHVGNTDASELGQRVRAKHPDMPIVLLIFDEADMRAFPNGEVPSTMDRVFHWTGNASVLIAAIKLIEDARNVDHDTAKAGVQVMLVVEDLVRAYSGFLGLLYPELLAQSGSLIAEGLNDFHRLTRMRARTKIVLATNYEEAVALYKKHKTRLCSLISDVRIPRGGTSDPQGGFRLAKLIRRGRPDLPILFQTAERGAETRARELGGWFVTKNAHNFRAQVRWFLEEALGFGDFVFRLPDRTEVARARDVYEMEQALGTVPAESVAYHAERNHFSVWLTARGMFQYAHQIRPRKVTDFEDVEELRHDLISVLQRARWQEQQGVITDLSARNTGPENRFVRIGRGSIGGKGRGVAFVSTQIVRHGLLERFENLQIRIPKTVVLGTDAFDRFMERLDVERFLGCSDEEATRRMLSGGFPDDVVRDLRQAFEVLKGPLAVRSSSLFEDSRFQPFAGVYATYMLPNNHPDSGVRFGHLIQAIKAVYSSVYWQQAQQYIAGTPDDPDEQRMAVVIQQVAGQRFGDRFYPHLSGVAQSYNYYPIGSQVSEDGVAHVALGLGHTVVGGGVALRFSPGAPSVQPQFTTAKSYLHQTQREFFAVDLGRPDVDLLAGPECSLISCDLETAEQDGTLAIAGSVYCAEDDVIRDNLTLPGPRVITFNNILKWNAVPLAESLSQLLTLLRQGMGEEVEIEFALDMSSWGRDLRPGEPLREPRLYVLQLRPMTSPEQPSLQVDLAQVPADQILARTDQALGHGSSEVIHDIVSVRRRQLAMRSSRRLVRPVSELCRALREAGRPFLLVGPGRWGSADPLLGIGVNWGDISGVRAIVELPMAERHVEPSHGTHFFRNITAAKVAYLTIEQREGSELDRGWLDEMWQRSKGPPAAAENDDLRHVRLERPLGVHVDGRGGCAVILKDAVAIRASARGADAEDGL